ncbi:MAG: hypothetical protein QMB63_03760 [Clostridiaceae bacterium]
MDRRKELLEARDASDEVLELLDMAISKLKSAKNWGIWDIMGGGLISNLIKRNKITSANQLIQELNVSMKRLMGELDDIDMKSLYGLSDTTWDLFFDIGFDNIFTDVRVQREIGSNLKKLESLRDRIIQIRTQVDDELRRL